MRYSESSFWVTDDGLQIGRARLVDARLVAAEEALHAHPLGGDDSVGVDRGRRIDAQLQRATAPLVGM